MRLLRLEHRHSLAREVYDTYEIPDDWDVGTLFKKHGEHIHKFLENSEAKKVEIEVLDFYDGKVWIENEEKIKK